MAPIACETNRPARPRGGALEINLAGSRRKGRTKLPAGSVMRRRGMAQPTPPPPDKKRAARLFFEGMGSNAR